MSGADRRLKPENYEAARARWSVVAAVVADHEGVALTAVRFGGGDTRAGPGLIRARRLSCYLAGVAANMSGHEISNVSRLTRKTIREHVQAVEDQRDVGDTGLDVELDALTAEIQLVLARRDYAVRRRMLEGAQALEAAQQTAPPPTARVIDPALDALLSAWQRAEDAKASWRDLCAATDAQLSALETAQGAAVLRDAAQGEGA